MSEHMNVGIVGCGSILAQYVRTLQPYDFLRVAALADLDPGRARAQAAALEVEKACSVEGLLGDPELQLVVNLTPPASHAEVSLAAIRAGKHVYTEKPLATCLRDAERIVSAARDQGVRVGCAPDTFLGPALQTCRRLLDDGRIGTPVGATAFVANRGPDHWHPNPAFFYASGAGPMLDVGVYYITALVSLLGPVRRVSGSVATPASQRHITQGPAEGQTLVVQTPTHIAGTLDFAQGAVGLAMSSFEVWASELPRIEIYGSEGTLAVPDPNCFDGTVRVFTSQHRAWVDVPHTHPDQGRRGVGVLDMAHATREGRPHRASRELAFHVLECMLAFEQASNSGCYVTLQSTCARPDPLTP